MGAEEKAASKSPGTGAAAGAAAGLEASKFAHYKHRTQLPTGHNHQIMT